MYWLNSDERKVVANFFAERFAGACVVKGAIKGVDSAREILPYTLEETSAAVAGITVEDYPDGVGSELTAFVRHVNDALAKKFSPVYAAWYPDNGPIAGTFYRTGVGDDPASDCTIQDSMLAGEEKPAELLDVYELGEWVVEQIVFAIESEQFDGDVEVLFSNLSRKLSVL